jgi:trehalose 2-sulfotransferase
MKHTQSYIICATPRSGTTLLCDLLADTGVTGRPDSFFRQESKSWWADYLNVSMAAWDTEQEFDQAYLDAVLKEGTAGSPVFGMRLMWESVGDLLTGLDSLYPGMPDDRTRFQSAFGPPVYVHIFREDKVAQAVSLVKAEQTGLWHRDADGSERERMKPAQAPVYDGQALSQQVAKAEEHNAAWASWFAEQQIQPVRITYEALSANPQATLATILAALGLNPAIAETVEPRTAKLSDRESREWATRFREEQP